LEAETPNLLPWGRPEMDEPEINLRLESVEKGGGRRDEERGLPGKVANNKNKKERLREECPKTNPLQAKWKKGSGRKKAWRDWGELSMGRVYEKQTQQRKERKSA